MKLAYNSLFYRVSIVWCRVSIVLFRVSIVFAYIKKEVKRELPQKKEKEGSVCLEKRVYKYSIQ